MTLGRWHDFEFYGNDTWKRAPEPDADARHCATPTSRRPSPTTTASPTGFRSASTASTSTAATSAPTRPAAGLPRSLVNPYKAGIQPRVGLAWDIKGDGKTALRMGFGRYISRSNVIASLLRLSLNPPWTTQVDTGWAGSARRASPTARPAARSTTPTPPCSRARAQDVGAVNSRRPELQAARELAVEPDRLARGDEEHRGRSLLRRQPRPAHLAPHQRRLQRGETAVPGARGRGRTTLAAHPDVAAGSTSATASRATSPPATRTTTRLQVWVDRRFTNRLAFQAAYTWSHTHQQRPDPVLHQRHDRCLQLRPRPRRRRPRPPPLLRLQHGLRAAVASRPGARSASAVLGDWQLNAIASFYSGTPLNIFTGVDRAGLGGATTQRPNLVPGVPDLHRQLRPTARCSSTGDAFALPARGPVRHPRARRRPGAGHQERGLLGGQELDD